MGAMRVCFVLTAGVLGLGCAAGPIRPIAPAATAAPPPVAEAPPAPAAVVPPPAPPAIRGERGDLPLYTVDGQETRLAAVGARVTVVSVWGTSCAPCIRELPYVDALYDAVRGDPDVAVLSVVIDDYRDPKRRDAVRDIVSRLGLRLPVLFDRDVGVYKRLNGEDAPGKSHEGIVVPQLVYIDPAFSIRRTFGFKVQAPIADFVRDQRLLIDLAKRGRLPPEDPRPGASSGAGARLVPYPAAPLGPRGA
jgi:thiol-disulfide isomerase/thioredoxin